MRVVVDLKALEALCDAAEDKHRLLVNRLRNSVRAEPKAEELSKVVDYVNVTSAEARPDPVTIPPNYGATPNPDNYTIAPRKRSAVSDK